MSINSKMNKLWYIHTLEYHTARKKNVDEDLQI